ncbi:hypothetical protein GPJ56_000665 [Histomonas meleagridis]|uniref:uncharacterized protein n=1 Tax=Histomonas meleagridis TaxID=135588 RepID=UPI003559492D|nr:hypothetical protein GPJ56_000665 [Histomonas meleagridis]KAH0804794.1 hypothetical protein GO595_002488 [Histomonas meleagridis]
MSVSQKRPITKEDIIELKLEKQKLLDERTQLKAKIARLEIQSKRSTRIANVNPQLLTQLDKEYKAIENQVQRQRTQLNSLLSSDNAAQRQELQEESKILYQERIRLQELQLQQQITLNEAKSELKRLMALDGPEVLEKQEKKIKILEEKIKKYKIANHKLSAKVKNLKEQRALEEESQKVSYESRVAKLKAQIKRVEKATEEVEDKITESIEKHQSVMNELKVSLLQKEIKDYKE